MKEIDFIKNNNVKLEMSIQNLFPRFFKICLEFHSHSDILYNASKLPNCNLSVAQNFHPLMLQFFLIKVLK